MTDTTRADTITAVTLYADAGNTPALTSNEVGVIVDTCALADTAGLRPSEVDWTPTYWTEKAVQKALELRALRARTITDITTDGTTVAGSQLAAGLTYEAGRWRARCATSVDLTTLELP